MQAQWQQALALHRQGHLATARAAFEAILKVHPKHVDSLNMLGVIAAQARDPRRAVVLFGKAIDIDPNNAVAHCNRGLALQALGKLPQALASFEQAIAIDGGYAEAHFNLGNVLKELEQLAAAVASYDRAIAIDPGHAAAHSNRGVVQSDLRQLDAALESFNRAIAIDGDYAPAYVNRAFARLLRGEFDGGWRDYEWRWRLGGSRLETVEDFARRRWFGDEPIAGARILLYSEQGLGDSIQFCRYVQQVAARGAVIVLEVQKPLMSLLSQLPGLAQIIGKETALPEFDYQCPFLSLPAAFKTQIGNIPGSAAYLRADPVKVARWRSRLGQSTQPRIGLAWSGNKSNKNDRNRSIVLADLIPHLPPNFRYVCLQKEIRDYDRRTLRSHGGIGIFSDELQDFSDTAALCECMDLVICVDTAVAHLSGALGKRTWLLLAHNANWRWLLGRRDCPWYSSVELYRQERRADWSAVFRQIEEHLSRTFASTCRSDG